MAKTGLIALVSLPGAGKSTIGRHLARRLNRTFLDTDSMIERRTGCSVRQYFEREGEARFRDLEEQVLADLTGETNAVLATGGGTVLREANRRWLARTAVVVYLRSAPEELYRRLQHDTKRPLLQVADPLARLKEMHAERDPLYSEIARFTLDTGRSSMPMLVNKVATQLELAGLIEASGPALETDPDPT